jgi:hypothetical protein
MNMSAETSSPQFKRNEVTDSGVDLTEPPLNNSVHNLLTHGNVARSHSSGLVLVSAQENLANHPCIGKTSSSPIPEQSAGIHRPSVVPLSAVLSAPAPSMHSYYSSLHSNSNAFGAQPNSKPKLTISDEDEQENSIQSPYNESSIAGKRLGQFSSLRNRNARMYGQQMRNTNESVSPYLGVDTNADSVCNTFIQPNSGMRGKTMLFIIERASLHRVSMHLDVPKWLKNLRLHKYAFFFSQMTYDQMMNLTIDQLKEGKITDGACTKILLNIKKLKERLTMLQKCSIDIDHDQIDLKSVVQQLNELMSTPIRAKQSGQNDDDDLPALIMDVLEKGF